MSNNPTQESLERKFPSGSSFNQVTWVSNGTELEGRLVDMARVAQRLGRSETVFYLQNLADGGYQINAYSKTK